MPKIIKPLSEIQIRKAVAKNKPYKMYDGDGLYLIITVHGTKLWRFDYVLHGIRKTLAFGKYPEVTLAEAREKRLEARRAVAQGTSPALVTSPIEYTFGQLATEWLLKFTDNLSQKYKSDVESKLRRDVYPYFSEIDIRKITVQDMLAVLQRIDARGARESAHRMRGVCSRIFRYGMVTERCNSDVAAVLIGAIPPCPPDIHYAAILDPVKLGEFLRSADDYQGQFLSRCAIQLLPLLFCRTGELRHMEWSEIDIEKRIWTIPAEKMKMKTVHSVPLCRQAIEIIEKIRELRNRSRYVFPSLRGGDRPISDNTMLSAFRRMGYEKHELTGHGFRATARTLLDEVLGYRVEIIELQLAHAVKDANGRAYNRTTFWRERVEMMQAWGDYLDELRFQLSKITG